MFTGLWEQLIEIMNTGASLRMLPVGLVLRFIVVAIVALVSSAGVLTFRPELLASYHYNQQIIALTHLFVLGWMISVVMGATYQLVPVALETKLHSEGLVRWQFGFHTAGWMGMVWMFWVWNPRSVAVFGVVFALGAVLFLYNLVRTLAGVRQWTVVAAGIACASGWLAFALAAGLFAVSTKIWPIAWFDPLGQMHAHAHLGVVGFFLVMLVSVSFKLVPMFLLSEVQSKRRAWGALILLNMGLGGLTPCILFGWALKPFFAAVIVCGVIIYLWELRAMALVRKRRVIDPGLKYFFTAGMLLVPVLLLGLALSWPGVPLTAVTGQFENLYGWLALAGTLTLAIIGMLYKIVPFLVWYSRYARDVGRSRVPTMAEMYSARLQRTGFWSYLAGLAVVSMGIIMANERIVAAGAFVWLASLTLFCANMAIVLSHLKRRPVFAPRVSSSALDKITAEYLEKQIGAK